MKKYNIIMVIICLMFLIFTCLFCSKIWSITANALDNQEYVDKCITNRESAIIYNSTYQEVYKLVINTSIYNRSIITSGINIINKKDYFMVEAIGYRTTDNQEYMVNKYIERWSKRCKFINEKNIVNYIAKTIANRTKYKIDDNLCYTAYGAYKGQAVCQGISILAKKMFDIKNIKNELVIYEKHMYNAIYIKGKKYNIDITQYIETLKTFPELKEYYCII